MAGPYPLGWTDLHAVNAGKYAIARLERFGVRVSPVGRLLRAHHLIQHAMLRGGADSRVDQELAHAIVEAHRTLIEFYVITTALDQVADITKDRLNAAMGGSAMPVDESDTSGRDAQFELLVGALVHHSGIRGVSMGEPDFRIRAGSRMIGIAAKRITSDKQLQRHVRKAAHQVRRLGDYGVVALNLDAFVDHAFEARGEEAAREAFTARTVEAESYLHGLADGPYVAGIYGFATLIGWSDTVPASLHLDFLAHAHWRLPDEDKSEGSKFLLGRGRYLATRLMELVRDLI